MHPRSLARGAQEEVSARQIHSLKKSGSAYQISEFPSLEQLLNLRLEHERHVTVMKTDTPPGELGELKSLVHDTFGKIYQFFDSIRLYRRIVP